MNKYSYSNTNKISNKADVDLVALERGLGRRLVSLNQPKLYSENQSEEGKKKLNREKQHKQFMI